MCITFWNDKTFSKTWFLKIVILLDKIVHKYPLLLYNYIILFTLITLQIVCNYRKKKLLFVWNMQWFKVVFKKVTNKQDETKWLKIFKISLRYYYFTEMFDNIYMPFASFFFWDSEHSTSKQEIIFFHVINMVFKKRPTSYCPQLLSIHKQLE